MKTVEEIIEMVADANSSLALLSRLRAGVDAYDPNHVADILDEGARSFEQAARWSRSRALELRHPADGGITAVTENESKPEENADKAGGVKLRTRKPRVCAVCGKDLFRKKVWEKFGNRVIGYCCMPNYTFCRDGSIRRRDEDDPTVPKINRPAAGSPTPRS